MRILVTTEESALPFDSVFQEVVGVQQDRGIDRVAQGHRSVDVVVVAVGADDRDDPAAVDSL